MRRRKSLWRAFWGKGDVPHQTPITSNEPTTASGTQQEALRELTDVPPSDTGAPQPAVIASEIGLDLLYHVNVFDPDWDGSYMVEVGHDSAGAIAHIRFDGTCHTFGPPNDEAIAGHPLYRLGLQPYGAYEVLNSSWVHNLERRN